MKVKTPSNYAAPRQGGKFLTLRGFDVGVIPSRGGTSLF
jgi:hypothetical protein